VNVDEQRKPKPRWYYISMTLLYVIFFASMFLREARSPALKDMSVLIQLLCVVFLVFLWLSYGLFSRVIRVRFTLGQLLVTINGLAASIAMILSKDDLWVTLGIVGLILIICSIIAALGRAGKAPLADETASK